LWLIEEGYDLAFFPTQLRMDPFVIQDIKQVMKQVGGDQPMDRVVESPVQTVEELVDRISATDIVVAARFHGVLISYLLNKPVLGISYHQKTEELMTVIGQEDYVVDMKDCNLPNLVRTFNLLSTNAVAVKREIEGRVLEYRRVLDEQYDRLFSLLGETEWVGS
jgi:polysaccharide pyruvyl transferase WcaK-like protein